MDREDAIKVAEALVEVPRRFCIPWMADKVTNGLMERLQERFPQFDWKELVEDAERNQLLRILAAWMRDTRHLAEKVR